MSDSVDRDIACPACGHQWRVTVLESLPGVGKVKARRTMEELEISENRRVRGLGTHQRRALLEHFER